MMATAATSRPVRARVQTGRFDQRLLAWVLAVALAIVAVQTVGHVVDWLAFDLDVKLLDADSDICIYAWVATVSIFLAGDRLLRHRPHRPAGRAAPVPGARAGLPVARRDGGHPRAHRQGRGMGRLLGRRRASDLAARLPAADRRRRGPALALRGAGAGARATLHPVAASCFLAPRWCSRWARPKLADGQHGRWAYQLEVIVEQNSRARRLGADRPHGRPPPPSGCSHQRSCC